MSTRGVPLIGEGCYKEGKGDKKGGGVLLMMLRGLVRSWHLGRQPRRVVAISSFSFLYL